MKKVLKELKKKYKEVSWELHIFRKNGLQGWTSYRKNKKLGFPKRHNLFIHPDWEMYLGQQTEEIEAIKRGAL